MGPLNLYNMVIWYMVPGAYFFVGGESTLMLESMVILRDLEGVL